MHLFVEFLQEPKVDRLRAAPLTLCDEERGDKEVVHLADFLTYWVFVLLLCSWMMFGFAFSYNIPY